MKENPKLFYCEYDPSNDRIMIKEDKIAEMENFPNKTIGQTTENLFRQFMNDIKGLMQNVQLARAWFNKKEVRANGLYWNTSVLIIPIAQSKNYYRISYYS